MNIYIIRHGETVENFNEVYQTVKTKLSKKGKKQAHILEIRVKKIKIDSIITSSYERTVQTSEIINKNLKLPIKKSSLFIERKRPTVVEGLKYTDPTAQKIKKIVNANYHKPEFRHSDEETFQEMKKRGQKALEFLTRQSQENILVVTHGEFIMCLFGLILFGEKFRAQEFLNIKEKLLTNNTGITLCEYKNNTWKLITWNDHAHLG